MIKQETEHGVSVLICTYNGSGRLHQTLNAFTEQINVENINWEIIVIDNASTDNSGELAENFLKNTKIKYKVLLEPRPGKTNAIELGFNNAKYEYVCIVDDDNWVCRDYIFKVYNIMSVHPDIAICGAKGEGVFEEEPPAWLKLIENAYGIGPQGNGEGYLKENQDYLYGASSVIRRTYWEELKKLGFKFNLTGRMGKALTSGEDMELSLAMLLLGHKLWYSPSITFKHFMPLSRINLPYLVNLFKAFGRSDIIANQYRIFLNRYSYKKKSIYSFYILHVIYYIYKLAQYMHWKTLFSSKISSYDGKILTYIRYKSYFIQLLHSRKSIKSVRRNIQHFKTLIDVKY